jgi:hypothetical protein
LLVAGKRLPGFLFFSLFFFSLIKKIEKKKRPRQAQALGKQAIACNEQLGAAPDL